MPDRQDLYFGVCLAGGFGGIVLAIVGIFLLAITIVTNQPLNALPITFIMGGPPLSILSFWWFHEDRVRVSLGVLRAPWIIHGQYHHSIGKFKALGRMVADRITEFDPTHQLYTVNEQTLYKALGFQRRKHRAIRILDMGLNEPSDSEKIRMLRDNLIQDTDVKQQMFKTGKKVEDIEKVLGELKAQYQTAWIKRMRPLPKWANHFTQVDLRYEYFMKDLVIWQLYVVTAQPFASEFVKMDYVLPGMRPMLFIECQAAPAWLIRIGEATAEMNRDKDHVTAPIVTPFVDLAFSEGIMRHLATDDLARAQDALDERLPKVDAYNDLQQKIQKSLGIYAEKIIKLPEKAKLEEEIAKLPEKAKLEEEIKALTEKAGAAPDKREKTKLEKEIKTLTEKMTATETERVALVGKMTATATERAKFDEEMTKIQETRVKIENELTRLGDFIKQDRDIQAKLNQAIEDTRNIEETRATSIAIDAKRIVMELLKALVAYQQDQIETYERGDSETQRKNQQLESDNFVLQRQVRDYQRQIEEYLTIIQELQNQIVHPEPEKAKYSGKSLAIAVVVTLFGGTMFGVMLALLLHLSIG
jgi:hypothetical protein